MAATDVSGYLQILQIAAGIGMQLYEGIRGIIADHAAENLTPQDYADLEAAWSFDKLRAAANAGLDAATGQPLIPPTA